MGNDDWSDRLPLDRLPVDRLPLDRLPEARARCWVPMVLFVPSVRHLHRSTVHAVLTHAMAQMAAAVAQMVLLT